MWNGRSRLCAIAVVMLLSGVEVQQVAASTTTGGGTFTGVVTLATFPCGSCATGGSFAGQVTLSLSGLSTSGVPYSAAWVAPVPPAANVSAGFGYGESCVGQPDGSPPLIGTAGGTFSVTGGTAVVNYAPMNPATLTGNFNWTRVGTAVSIQFTNLVITAGAGNTRVAVNLANTVAGLTVGQGASTFVWTNGPGVCGGPAQSNQTAEVAGVSLQPA